MNSTDTNAIRTNSFGTAVTYQTLADWRVHVGDIKTVYGLNSAKGELINGNIGMANCHEFTPEEGKKAWFILSDRAKQLECFYDKIGRRFRENISL